jgi:hypothetical protein
VRILIGELIIWLALSVHTPPASSPVTSEAKSRITVLVQIEVNPLKAPAVGVVNTAKVVVASSLVFEQPVAVIIVLIVSEYAPVAATAVDGIVNDPLPPVIVTFPELPVVGVPVGIV